MINEENTITNGEEMDLSESEEMYLESILRLSIENDIVRSVDIAKYMDYSKPSVSVAVKKLKNYGLIKDNNSSSIELTDLGYEIASGVYEKHNVLANILIHLGVEKKQAIEDACKMEHVISEESFEIIKKYFESNKN